jgi:hypothetical protein
MAFLDSLFHTNIVLWLEASSLVGLKHGDDVLSWPNKNGASVATGAAGATGVYQENQLNGYPTVLFDGINDVMTLSANWSTLLDVNGGGCVFVLFKPLAKPAPGAFATVVGGGSAQNPTLELQTSAGGVENLRVTNYDGTLDVSPLTPYSLIWQLGVWRHTANTLYIYRNDMATAAVLPGTASGVSATLGWPLTIGGGVAGRNCNMNVAAIIVLNAVSNTTTMLAIAAYLFAKYSSPAVVDADHYSPMLRGDSYEQTRDVNSRRLFERQMRSDDILWTGPIRLADYHIGDVLGLVHQLGPDPYGVGGGWTSGNPKPHRIISVGRKTAVSATLLLRPLS